jgi:hypothetical protein
MLGGEFDEETIARMEEALRFACQHLPPGRQDHETRKFIAERILECARRGQVGLQELTNAAVQALKDLH